MIEQVKKEKDAQFARVILASSSEVRNEVLNQYFLDVVNVPHSVEEEKFKTLQNSPEEIVHRIAKEKALSVAENYPNEMIVASDQILLCENKVISKPKTLEEAKQKLLFLRNKTHKLYSSIYVIQNQKLYFQQVKKATLFFANITQKEIEAYVKNNTKTALTTVGSYKIEENTKYKFIKIIDGDIETILGFPVKDLMKKIKNEK